MMDLIQTGPFLEKSKEEKFDNQKLVRQSIWNIMKEIRSLYEIHQGLTEGGSEYKEMGRQIKVLINDLELKKRYSYQFSTKRITAKLC